MEMQWERLVKAMLADTLVFWFIPPIHHPQAHLAQVAIDLIGAGEYQGRWTFHCPQRFQKVQSAPRINFEIFDGILEAGSYSHLGRKVEYHAGLSHAAAQRLKIADIPKLVLDQVPVFFTQPGKVLLHAGAG